MQAESNTPKLNPTQLYLTARALNDSMKEFYKDPKNKKAFEKWRRKKRKEAQSGQDNGTDSSGD